MQSTMPVDIARPPLTRHLLPVIATLHSQHSRPISITFTII